MFWLMACSQDYTPHYEVIETVAGEMMVESWTAVEPALDIMVIVDQSCSMHAERQWLVYDMIDIVWHLDDRGDVDWRINTRPADIDAGSLVWLDSDSANLEGQIFTNFSITWSTHEHGLGSGLYTMIWDTWRDDADSLIWILSDEDDQSPNANPTSYMETAAAFKSDPYRTTTISTTYQTIAQAESCGGNGQEVGERYHQVSDLETSLCDSSGWVPAVDYVIDKASDVNRYHYLQFEPDIFHPVYIFWDGIQLQNNYELDGKLVTFDRIPYPGTVITAAYMVKL